MHRTRSIHSFITIMDKDFQSIVKIVAKQTLEPLNPWILESSSPIILEKN